MWSQCILGALARIGSWVTLWSIVVQGRQVRDGIASPPRLRHGVVLRATGDHFVEAARSPRLPEAFLGGLFGISDSRSSERASQLQHYVRVQLARLCLCPEMSVSTALLGLQPRVLKLLGFSCHRSA